MPYESMPWDKQILAVDLAIAKVDEAILALHAQNFAVQSRLMLRRAQMAKFLSKVNTTGKGSSQHGEFNEALESNANVAKTIQSRIASLSNRAATLRTTRIAIARAKAVAESTPQKKK